MIEKDKSKNTKYLRLSEIFIINITKREKEATLTLSRKLLKMCIKSNFDTRNKKVNFKLREIFSKCSTVVGIMGTRERRVGKINLRSKINSKLGIFPVRKIAKFI